MKNDLRIPRAGRRTSFSRFKRELSRRDYRKHEFEVAVAELDATVRDAMRAHGDKITEGLKLTIAKRLSKLRI